MIFMLLERREVRDRMIRLSPDDGDDKSPGRSRDADQPVSPHLGALVAHLRSRVTPA
jgi:hypothetical protein